MKSGTFSGVLLVLTLALALAFASSLEPTAVGLIALAFIPVLLIGALTRQSAKRSLFFGTLVTGGGVYAAWVASRSPVIDFGRSDGLLLGCGLASCCWAGWLVQRSTHRVAAGGLALLALANVAVALIQWKDPSFTPIFAGRETSSFPSGFYAHYNHFASFLLGCGFLSAGCALLPGSRRWPRISWALVAIACGGGIVLSQSRGAYFAAGVGSVVLIACWLLDLNRRRVKWFGIALISVLVLLPAAGFGAWQFARVALEDRGVKSDGSRMMDDSGRLDFAAMAIQLASEHPMTGAGSRSFSYEVFQKWDAKEMWVGSGDIDMVHNELLQVATDYGWIGLGLMVLLIFCTAARGAMCLAMEPARGGGTIDAGTTAGALAGIAAMLTQSMFSFVFHMAPDLVVLGLLIGMVVSQPWPLSSSVVAANAWTRPEPWMGATLAVVLGLVGWRDAAAWWLVARPGAAGNAADPEFRYRALEEALKTRPDFRIEQSLVQAASELATNDPNPQDGWSDREMEHQRSILARHPWNYAARLGLARLLDRLGQFREAEEHYHQLLPLLDNREMFYHTRFSYGSHAFRRAYALWQARRSGEAMAWAQEARNQMEISRTNAVFDSDRTDEYKKVVDFITWLEGAHVAPQPGVVPELK